MTEIQSARFNRRPFSVDAIQVTAENMEAAALWCKGKIEHTRADESRGLVETPFVKVEVYAPRNVRQTRAFRGDWIVKADNGTYRVYPKKAFELAFEPIKNSQKYATKP